MQIRRRIHVRLGRWTLTAGGVAAHNLKRRAALDATLLRMHRAKIGQIVRLANDRGYELKIRRVHPRVLGISIADSVIREARSWLGTPYTLGGMGPAGIDCSGLMVVAFAAEGIMLPHGAELIRNDPRVVNYDHRQEIEPADMVFYWYPNNRGIPQGHASHVGLLTSATTNLEASTSEDAVVERGILWERVIGYGKVRGVTAAEA